MGPSGNAEGQSRNPSGWFGNRDGRSRDTGRRSDPEARSLSEPAETVRDTLLEYAERGVFRGFDLEVGDGNGQRDGELHGSHETSGSPRRVTFHFFWIGPRPFRISLSPDGRTLTAEGLLPSVGNHPRVSEDLERFVGERVSGAPAKDGPDEGDRKERDGRPPSPGLPPHRRIDPERAHASLLPGEQGGLDLSVTVRGDHHEYAVRKLLNLINEIWVRLQDRHQRYLWDVFDAPME